MAEKKVGSDESFEHFNAMNARHIIEKQMLGNDLFSQWAAMEITHIDKDSVSLTMQIRDEMTNGFKISHGGILYSLCDSALAFAANSYGRKAVTIQASMSYIRPTKTGDKVRAIAKVRERSKTLAHYEVLVHSDSGRLLSIFEGTVYFTGDHW
jgi:acyl-CoA thioesterase